MKNGWVRPADAPVKSETFRPHTLAPLTADGRRARMVQRLSGLDEPPASPADGDRYIVAAGAIGAWADHDGEVATFVDGAWEFATPEAGWLAYDVAGAVLLVYVAGAWHSVGGYLGTVDQLGVNAAADDTNRLAVRSAAILLSAIAAGDGGTGDIRVVVNKEADGDTATLLFQRDFSGRAEVGLAGDTDLVFKVSADGASWIEAIRIDKDTGLADILYDNAVSGLAATSVQDAIDELAAGGGGGGGGGGDDNQTAAEVPFTPGGNVAADNVQEAIEELDSEKAAASHAHGVADLSDASADARALLQTANYAAMRALLDLEAGTDFLSPAAVAAAYQALDATLTALAGVTTAADKLIYATGSDAFATTDLTSAARTLLAQTTQALMRTTGLGMSANGSSLVGAADYAAMRALLDLEAGTDFHSLAAADAAFIAKSLLTTRGDIITRGASAPQRLAAGAARKVLVSDGTDPGYAYPALGLNQQSGTSYTLALTDAFGTIECSNAGNITVTVPANATTAFPIGSIIKLRQTGFGGLVITPAGGVTVNAPLGMLALFQRYGEAWLEKTGTDTWQLDGRLVYSGTNLLSKTEQINDAAWFKEHVTVSANATAAPDGQTTADAVMETTDNDVHRFSATVSKAASRIRYTMSGFFKAGLGRDFVRLAAFNGGFSGGSDVLFDITGGLFALSGAYGEFTQPDHFVEDFGNGWFRCGMSFVSDADTALPCFVILNSNMTTSTYAGDVAKGAYVWGMQLEASPRPGIYRVAA